MVKHRVAEEELDHPGETGEVEPFAGLTAFPNNIPPAQGPPADGFKTPPSQGMTRASAPTLSTLTPSTIAHGAGATTTVIAGTNFAAGSIAFAGSVALATTYTSATSISAVIPASMLAAAGTLNVTVANGDNQTTTSSPFTVT